MARIVANTGSEKKEKMQALAGFIHRLESDELWALLDALFPGMGEDDKEDIYGAVISAQRSDDVDERPAEDVFHDLLSD